MGLDRRKLLKHVAIALLEIMIDLSIEVSGVKFEFPLALSAGPLSRDGASIKRAARQYGVGAIFTKTIAEKYRASPQPSMITANGGLINYDWEAPGVDEMVRRELKIAKEGGKPVIASVKGTTIDSTIRMAKALEKAGADMIEIPISTIPIDELVEEVRMVKEAIDIPLIIKVGPNLPDIKEYARAIESAGADAISGINTIGPCLIIDVKTGRPLLGSRFGYGYLSGPAIKPIAIRCIAEIAKAVNIPVFGGGGVFSGRDAIEMFMVGAKCVCLHTAAILKGIGIFSKVIKEIEEFMREMNYESLEEIRGIALKHLRDEEDYTRRVAVIDTRLCSKCGTCERVCTYGALKLVDGKPMVIEDSCHGCGLCMSICPREAIRLMPKSE